MFKYNLVIGNSFGNSKQSYTQINYDFVPNSVDKQKNGLLEVNEKKGTQEQQVTVKLAGTDGEDKEYNQQASVKYNQEITKQCVLVVNQDAVGGPTLTLERVSQIVAVRKNRGNCGKELSNADVPQSFSKPPTVAKRQRMQAPPVQNQQNPQNPQIMQNSQPRQQINQQLHKTNQIQSQRQLPPVPAQNQMPQQQFQHQNLPTNGNEGNNGSSSSSGSGSSSSGSSSSGSGSSSSESEDENNEGNQQIGGQMGQISQQMGQIQQQQGGLQSFAQNNNPYNAPITSNQPNTGNGTSLGGFASFYNAKPQTAVETTINDDLRMSSSESEVD